MNPTGSSFTRADACPPFCALPHSDLKNPDASRGDSGHLYVAHVPGMGAAKALALVPPEHRAMCEEVELEGLPLDPDRYQQEVTFAYDVATGQARIVGSFLQRRYPDAPASVVYGTLDVVGLPEDEPDLVEIDDYKFDGYESHTPAPEEADQLLFGALAACRATGRTRARVRFIHIMQGGGHWIEGAEFDEVRLDAFACKLQRLLERVRAAEREYAAGRALSVHRGPWCRYCPAAAACPAVLGLVRALAQDARPYELELRGLLTPQTAGEAFRRLKEAKSVLSQAEAALRAFAWEHPIDLGGGQWYGAANERVERFDADRTFELLEEKYDSKVAVAGMTFKTSKAGVERAIDGVWRAKKAAGEKVTKKSLVETMLEELRRRGAANSTTKPKLKLFHLDAGQLPEPVETAGAQPPPDDEEPPPPDDSDAPPFA